MLGLMMKVRDGSGVWFLGREVEGSGGNGLGN